jgi:hypothetical protein
VDDPSLNDIVYLLDPIYTPADLKVSAERAKSREQRTESGQKAERGRREKREKSRERAGREQREGSRCLCAVLTTLLFIQELETSDLLSLTLDGQSYIPGIVGLNDIKVCSFFLLCFVCTDSLFSSFFFSSLLFSFFLVFSFSVKLNDSLNCVLMSLAHMKVVCCILSHLLLATNLFETHHSIESA